jgi:hypothetical protein
MWILNLSKVITSLIMIWTKCPMPQYYSSQIIVSVVLWRAHYIFMEIKKSLVDRIWSRQKKKSTARGSLSFNLDCIRRVRTPIFRLQTLKLLPRLVVPPSALSRERCSGCLWRFDRSSKHLFFLVYLDLYVHRVLCSNNIIIVWRIYFWKLQDWLLTIEYTDH